MISLCMITRDEERFLARCLSSVQAIVDEIIVVDTGSVDRTKQIAMSFGARVYEFKWRDDFASARNFAISKAAGSRLFSLDADEVVSECDAGAIKGLATSAVSKPVAYSFVTRNYICDSNLVGWVPNNDDYCPEQAGTGWVPSEKIRLFPRQPGICYEYPVHEMVEPSIKREGIEIRKSTIPIHHYGPLQKDNKRSKMLAYYQMGKKKLQATKSDEMALYELAIQAGSLGKAGEAIELWQKFIALRTDRPEAFVHLATAYFQQQDYLSAQRASKKALALDPAMKEAIYNYSLCEFMIGDIGKTIAYLERLLEKFPEFRPARFLAAAANICMGDKQRGLSGLKELCRTEMGPDLSATYRDLIQKLAGANRPDCARALIKNATGIGI
jgi:tetratricopeptide (TPR) repeat protein